MFPALRNPVTASAHRAFSTTPLARDFMKVTLAGRIAIEPHLGKTLNGHDMIRYSVEVNTSKDRPPTWYRVTQFSPDVKTKDYMLTIPKGTWVLVEGAGNLRPIEGGDGKKYQSFEIIQRAISVILRPKKGKEEVEEEEAADDA